MSLRKKLKLNSTEINNIDENAESKYFRSQENTEEIVVPHIPNSEIPDKLLQIELDLVKNINTLTFRQPVDYVYSPLEYAFDTHSMFVKKYCTTSKKLLFLGLNPGPWGMSQTGVPFGEVNIVRDWFKISGTVGKPRRELACRQVTGLDCKRSEISGKRFWGLFQDLCGTPENFFKHAYMHNYCPIALMKDSGANITPADLKGAASTNLLNFCDESLANIIHLLQVEKVIAVGRFVEKRVKDVFKKHHITGVEVVFLLHPSPRVVGNENWQEKALNYLTDLDLIKYFKN